MGKEDETTHAEKMTYRAETSKTLIVGDSNVEWCEPGIAKKMQ